MLHLINHTQCRSILCSLKCHAALNVFTRQLCGETLKQRSLVQVQGTEAATFLQGLITNDVNHLEEGASSMYSMLLNTQGRVLFDTIVYRKHEESFIIECDSDKSSQLVRHLKMYRVRRKIDVKSVDDEFNIWCVFDPDINFKDITHVDMESLYMNPRAESEAHVQLADGVDNILVSRDPRMKYLGHRLIMPAAVSIDKVIPTIEKSKGLYRRLRYRLGVGEGITELPSTKCLPLEANCDYLHGVSFHKGCYVGQELTARTFHTGVIRKRYMPLIFSSDAEDVPFDSAVINEKGKSVGKVRGSEGQYGVGLLRIKECLEAKTLMVNDISVETFKPAWWPLEASKEKR